MLPYVVKKYNNTVHTSTGFKPNDAINDKHALEIRNKLEMNANKKRLYPTISVGDKVEIFKQPGNYGEAKESKSRWTDESYNVIDVNEGFSKTYKLENKAKASLRHELLLIT